MTQRDSQEKRTVERTDELLKKSRRLIDELEFILEKLDADSQGAKGGSRDTRGPDAEGARPK